MSNFYINSGSRETPSRSNILSQIQDDNIKSVFNKFFTNSSGSDHTTSADLGDIDSGWDNVDNINAFAYMRSNGVEGNTF